MLEYMLNFWKPIIEIIFLWMIFYVLLLFLKGTRAFQVLRGVVVIVIVFFIAQAFGLYTLNWILSKLLAISVIAFVVVFQPELRRGLASLGRRPLFHILRTDERVIDELVETAMALSKNRIGALVALEREAGLGLYVERGVQIDSRVTKELLYTIFMYGSPLHDGGVVIQGDRILSAGCLFPLTENPRVSMSLGTRHRAAIGLTEETDAVVIIVSEETGGISIAIGGRLTRHLDKDGFAKILRSLYRPKALQQNFWAFLAKGAFFKQGPFFKMRKAKNEGR